MTVNRKHSFIHRLTPERQAILDRLEQRPWWLATSLRIQHQLLSLPEDSAGRNNWNPLIEDLAARDDVVGGVRHLRLRALLAGNFGAIIQFEVKNTAGSVFTYEYFSWKHGPV